jgi:hypothetical protein
MSMRVSYFRMLIGDNGSPPTYTDAQLDAVATIPQPAGTGLPAAVLLAGVRVFRQFPSVVAPVSAESWAALTAGKWQD